MSTKSTTLTPRDIELLLAAMKSSKTEFTIDYDIFAKAAGLTSKASAATTWSALKKKLERYREEGAGAASPTKGGSETPKTTPGKGKKRKAADASAEVDDEEGTLSGKKGKRSRKSATPAKENSDAEETKQDSAVTSEPEE